MVTQIRAAPPAIVRVEKRSAMNGNSASDQRRNQNTVPATSDICRPEIE